MSRQVSSAACGKGLEPRRRLGHGPGEKDLKQDCEESETSTRQSRKDRNGDLVGEQR